jgi:hypothetical protein
MQAANAALGTKHAHMQRSCALPGISPGPWCAAALQTSCCCRQLRRAPGCSPTPVSGLPGLPPHDQPGQQYTSKHFSSSRQQMIALLLETVVTAHLNATDRSLHVQCSRAAHCPSCLTHSIMSKKRLAYSTASRKLTGRQQQQQQQQ